MTTATRQLSISPAGQEVDQIRRELLDTKFYDARGVACWAALSRRPFLIWSGDT